ncbi:uncharacterized protein LOC142239329 [Haematobia irritans]|uniref:uncharacterized protein LOC142239329 n=1 Tax=Haematobia irritans TaxID=7368 RepID=UPI003F507401
MRLIFFINVLYTYIVLISAAAYIGFQEHADHPGKCWDRIYGLGLFEPGEERNDPSICVRIKCHKGSIIESYSCGAIAKPEGCLLADAPVAPYPKCCDRKLICNET